MSELLLPLGAGLSGSVSHQGVALGDGSFNFYPDGEGYLVNYPGRTDWFYRPIDGQSLLGTPPTTTEAITRVITFRDVRGKEHIVFVRDDELCENVGNGYRVLYTFRGINYFGDKFFPDLFIHESKLIIVNFGDPVLLWDGLEGVHPLGVQEIPLPPDTRVGPMPWTEETVGGDRRSKAYGPWRYKTFWWPGSRPYNGPGDNLGADGTTKVEGYYQAVIQFFDKYGNKGAVSPPSRITKVKPNYNIASVAMNLVVEYNDTPEWSSAEYLILDYYPPLTEAHIAGVLVGRTLSQNPDGGAGAEGVYFVNYTYQDTCIGRAVLRMSDGTLANQSQIDTGVRGPPQATGGCSSKNRIFLWGLEDPFLVVFSDKSLFGQFRTTNEYRAKDHVRRVIPVGDRILVITRSTTEVLYETANGDIGVLEQDFYNGSLYGRSFVDVGGLVFGLWNRGFGFYDGAKHTFVETPYFLQALYVDNRFHVASAIQFNDWYMIALRKDMQDPEPNYLLIYDMKGHRWFQVKESVYDLAIWKEAILGCEDSIYELFKGAFDSESSIVVQGLLPPDTSPLGQRNLINLRLLMEPSGIDNFEATVEGEIVGPSSEGGDMHSLPSHQSASRQRQPIPYWDTKFLYASEPQWGAPSDVWIDARLKKPVSGYLHTIRLDFPVSHQVRIKALGVTFGEEGRASVT